MAGENKKPEGNVLTIEESRVISPCFGKAIETNRSGRYNIIMFFIAFFGIEDKEKITGTYKGGICPSCGAATEYEIGKSYRYFHVFFIPLARWNVRYFVRTSCCGRIYELDGALGREFEKNPNIEIRKEDLRPVDGYSPFGHCPNCRAEVPADFKYCPYCGAKL